ncbi:hypothetical protein ABIF65_004962 [Bradyrhizobium japonicum]|uniref:hypothetical protein n=1 Tax=Bradyrhizobium TaxID=374 RepID=UPI00040491ED|nr:MULTISPECIES: hypothetical protein [Bradyrhizobium]MBR0884341.1 hypothetical protein [Bradyrhizobium liaoningense]MBR1001803.1 hypothetical protein [Bradyrhizobium liaoningense]MBR1033836.1 hypothetical protein [Bradyrhizobium liaoningense]MCP1743290.1 putative chitinase [Bradyrhizobium japonicum]MCP1781639.1 putative chitinase [Bradyrhizobium japonicum]
MAFIITPYNLWPNGNEKFSGLRDGIAISAPAVFAKYGINTPLLAAISWPRSATNAGRGVMWWRT